MSMKSEPHAGGGRDVENFEVGALFERSLTGTVTQMTNMLCSNMTLNPQQLQIDAHSAPRKPDGAAR